MPRLVHRPAALKNDLDGKLKKAVRHRLDTSHGLQQALTEQVIDFCGEKAGVLLLT